MRKNVLALLVISFVSLLGSQAFAQQEFRADQAPNALAAGKHSLSFAVPGGGNPYATGAFGYWMMLTPEINFGINVGFGLDRQGNNVNDDVTTNWDLLLAPALKFYTSRRSVVAPYYFAQLNLRLHDTNGNTDPELGLAGGLGVEWFPVTNFSIGGHAGLGIDILRAGNGEPIAVGTFTSGLSAQIYF